MYRLAQGCAKLGWYGIGDLPDLVTERAQQLIVIGETLEKHSLIDTESSLGVGVNVNLTVPVCDCQARLFPLQNTK